MAVINNTSTNVQGTGSGDIIVVESSTSPVNTTVFAGSGDDVVFSDHDSITFDNASISNNSIVNALNIDSSARWSTIDNPDVGDSTIPYTTVLARANAQQRDYWAVTIGAGESIVVDMDYGGGNIGDGASFDGFVRLLRSNGSVVAFDDDSLLEEGGAGSSSTFDPYLTYQNTTGQTQVFYIEVGRFTTGAGTTVAPVAFLGNETYMLNVSVTNHDNTNIAVSGNDTINGEAGNDVLMGLGGNDTIFGGANNDTINGGQGGDVLYGGDGDDTLSYQGGQSGVNVQLNSSFLDGDAEGDVAREFEHLIGTNFSDVRLYGDGQANSIPGLDGDDVLAGLAGTDSLFGGAGSDALTDFSAGDNDQGELYDGGDDFDRLLFQTNQSGTINYTDDTIRNIERFEIVRTGGSEVSVTAQFTADQFEDFQDVLISGPGTVSIEIQLGNSTALDLSALSLVPGSQAVDQWFISAGATSDSITGTAFDDLFNSAGGNDTINGLTGNDTLFGDSGNDTIFGGFGDDRLFGSADNDTLYGGDDADDVFGGFGFDELFGGSGNDTLDGDSEGDVLDGGLGNDTLEGDAGADIITAGQGNDTLIGGPDGDRYIFNLGDGDDLLVEDNTSGIDTLVLDQSVGLGDFSVSRIGDGQNLLVTLSPTDTVTLQFGGVSGNFGVERLEVQGLTYSKLTWVNQADGRIDNDLSGGFTDDILWFNTQTRQIGFYEMEGNSATWRSLGFAGQDYTAVATADFNDDGFADILWFNSVTNQIGFYRMDQGGSFTWQSLGFAGANYTVQGTGDFDPNGIEDILWLNSSTQQLGYYDMNDANFTWRSLGTAGQGYVVAGTNDFNNDGVDDILWFNTQTRQLGYYEMLGTNFTWKSLGIAGTNYRVEGTGDFNNDGNADILWFNTVTNQVGFYRMDGQNFTWQSLGLAGANYEVADIGDYNADGIDDILWYNTTTRQLGYYQMDDANFSWVDLGFAGANYEVAAEESLF